MDAKVVYEEWLASDLVDEDTKKELRRISGDEKEIEDRFYECILPQIQIWYVRLRSVLFRIAGQYVG